MECFRYWSIEHWKNIFEKNGLEVIEVKHSNIAYNMHKIFPFKFLRIRQFLAKQGRGSANLFILRKNTDLT